jgi:hypothetical protein
MTRSRRTGTVKSNPLEAHQELQLDTVSMLFPLKVEIHSLPRRLLKNHIKVFNINQLFLIQNTSEEKKLNQRNLAQSLSIEKKWEKKVSQLLVPTSTNSSLRV